MPRAKYLGFIALFIALCLGTLFVYAVFAVSNETNFLSVDLYKLNNYTYYAVAIPIGLVAFSVISTGFWIGKTILTIKVVPPMPEIVEKKDYSKIKAFLLCSSTFILATLLLYGVYIKNFWALAIPATAITLVILGAIFWVGIAIITTRSTLPDEKK